MQRLPASRDVGRRYPILDLGAGKKPRGVATSAFIQPVTNPLSARGCLSFFISIESQKAGLLILEIRITLGKKSYISEETGGWCLSADPTHKKQNSKVESHGGP